MDIRVFRVNVVLAYGKMESRSLSSIIAVNLVISSEDLSKGRREVPRVNAKHERSKLH